VSHDQNGTNPASVRGTRAQEPYVVLVCGSHLDPHYHLVYRTLDALDPRPELIVQGEARGVDDSAANWAAKRGIPCAGFRANWGDRGRAAGPIRNGWMLKFMRPALVIAFPGGKGTANMVEQARKAGVEVRVVRG